MAERRNSSGRIAEGFIGTRSKVLDAVAGMAVLGLIIGGVSQQACAAISTWNGSDDAFWSNPNNWNNGVPGSSDTAVFSAFSPPNTVANVGAAVTIGGLLVDQGAGAYTLSGTTVTLANSGKVEIRQGVSADQTINVVNFNVGPTGNQNNATYSFVNNSSGLLSFTGTNFQNGSTSTSSNLRTVTVSGIGNTTIATAYIGDASAGGTLNLVKAGTGSLTITGTNNANQFSAYGTALTGGVLVLDYGTNNTSKFRDGSSIILTGGTLVLKGGSHTETVSGVQIGESAAAFTGGGATTIKRDGGTSVLQMNAISRGAGGTINFEGNSLATTDSTNVAAGTLGGFATVGSAAGAYSWAQNSTNASDGAITAYSGETAWITSGASGSTNYLLTGSSTLAASQNVYNLKIDTTASGQSLALANNQTLTFGNASGNGGGLLFNGSHDYEITGSGTGGLRGGNITGGPLFIHQWGTGELTISATVLNSSASTRLVKTGTGTLILSGTNTYRGVTHINQGMLGVSSNVNLGDVAYGASININGGILQATASFSLDDAGENKRAVLLGGGGGTIDVTDGNTLEVSGVIGDAAVQRSSGPLGQLTKTNAGTLKLTGINTYTAGTFIKNGTLELGSTGSIDSSSFVNISADAVLDVEAKSAYVLNAAQPFTFELNPSGTGSAGLLLAAGLDITNGVVRFDTTGPLNDSVYVIARYSALTGGAFASVHNLPAGYTIDYDYADGTQIALVVPEPAGVAMLALSVMPLFRRRR